MKKAALILLIFLALQFATNLILSVVMLITKMPANNPWGMSISLAVVNLLIIAVAYLYLNNVKKNPLKGHLTPASIGLTILSLLGLCFLSCALNFITEICKVPDLLQTQFEGLMTNPVGILSICIIGPVAEEIIFRRGIMGSLMESAKWRKYALVISAAVFGIIHFNPVQVICAFALGMFLGWLYQRTHSIVLPILCHILNNTVSTVVTIITSYETKIMDVLGSKVLFFAILALLVLGSVGIVMLLKKRLPKAWPAEIEDK